MAAIQKIRSKKILLASLVGFAMFAFIAEAFVQCIGGTANQSRMTIGKVNGSSLSQMEFSDMVNDQVEALKMNGQIPESEVSGEVMAQIRDQVWQQYVSQKIIESECEQLGLTVSDAEVQAMLQEGTNPLLQQTPSFFKDQNGKFDINQLKQFLSQYDEAIKNPQITQEQRESIERIHKLWLYTEKQLKSSLLAMKYQVLVNSLVLINPVSAKANFENRANESDALMAALPYSTINDNDVKVEDSELQAKYNELKEMFKTNEESRDVKYIDVTITASAADKKALKDEMNEYAAALKDSGEALAIVSASSSLCPHTAFPVSKKSLPTDVAAKIDSLAVGAQTPVYYNVEDNTLNIVKLLSKVSRPDSIEFRQLACVDQDEQKAKKSADSIVNALKNGAPFDSIAKKYNQPAEKSWLTSQMYESATSIDENNKKFINAILTGETGSIQKIDVPNGAVIVEVTDRRNMEEKYDVAIVKRAQDFSRETDSKFYNEFSSFVASHATIESMEAKDANAKYAVLPSNGLHSYNYTIGNVQNTREAVQWVFNKDRKVGDVSEIYYCGDNNNHMLLVALTGIHAKGYLDLTDENVKNYCKDQVLRDKKAEKLQAQMAKAKSVADVAKMTGAVQDTIQHVTFAAPCFVQKMGAQEFVLSGAIAKAAKGKFVSGVKGNAGVYAFQVINRNKTAEKYDEKAECTSLAQQYSSNIMRNLMSDLVMRAEITDNRYLFY